MLGADLQGPRHRAIDGMVARLEAEDEQSVRAVPRHREARLAGIEQAAVARVERGLRDLAHALHSLGEAREAHTARASVGGARLYANPCLGYHPEDAL